MARCGCPRIDQAVNLSSWIEIQNLGFRIALTLEDISIDLGSSLHRALRACDSGSTRERDATVSP